jgi:hypothetical protein
LAEGGFDVASKFFEKPERVVGYVLLVVGVVVLVIPTYLGVSIIFSGGSAVPKILEVPTVSFDETRFPVGDREVVVPISAADVNEVIERLFPAVNLGLFLGVSVILVSAASVLMGKGVSLIKEVKLRAVREDVGEEVEVEKKVEAKEKLEK